MSPDPPAIEDLLYPLPVLPVLRSANPERAVQDVDRLRAVGLVVIELTTSTPEWDAALADVRSRWPRLHVGVGTVTTAGQAATAVAAGARFLVSPWPAPEVRPIAVEAGIPFLEGGFTPREIADAAGRGPAKLFPAHVGGPSYLRSLLAVLPQARIIPTGGVRLSQVADYLAAGAIAVGVGAALLDDPDLAGSLAALTSRTGHLMPDLVVIGEPLAELSADAPMGDGIRLTLGFSGDALNAAAAAAAAGAHTALLARVADDELGEALLAYAALLGIDVSAVRRVAAPQGTYLMTPDATGDRQFTYLRRGSAGSTLEPADVAALESLRPRAVLSSGIACALSTTARAAVLRAATEITDQGGFFVYDPNFRPRLTTAGEAAEVLRALAPYSRLVAPSCPGDTAALLGTEDPISAGRALLAMGAQTAVVTRGADGVLIWDGTERFIPAAAVDDVVDQTGAGDSFLGTMTARLTLGDNLDTAVRAGVEAAAEAVGAAGGTGHLRSRGSAAPRPASPTVQP